MFPQILKWLRFRVVFPALAILPRFLAYRVANLIGSCDARKHPERSAVTDGLTQLIPALTLYPLKINEQVIKHYQMLAKDTLDCFIMPRMTAANTEKFIKVKNIDVLRNAQQAGCGVIMIISHFDRFFMLGPGLNFAGIEFAMLTTVVDDRHPSYDKIDRWYMAKKLRNTQKFSRGTWITTADDPRKVYRCLRSGEIVLIAMDGNETTSLNRVSFPFLGGTLSLPGGIRRIASGTGARLVYAAVHSGGASVEIRLHELSNDPNAAFSQSVKLLEHDIAHTPSKWWLWNCAQPLWRPESQHKERESVCI